MKKSGHITSFYIETLLLIVVFISIILVITRVFGEARIESERAKLLTDAVTLAQSAAESFEAAESREELEALLCTAKDGSKTGGIFFTDSGDPYISAEYGDDFVPVTGGRYMLRLEWSEEDNGLTEAEIRVYYGQEEIYELDTASFKEAAL